MAVGTSTGAYFARLRVAKPQRLKSKASIGTFAASPAGQHRALALKAFALAKRARQVGNFQHYRRMTAIGKRALALSKAEIALWRRGQALGVKSFATHRAAKRAAAFR